MKKNRSMAPMIPAVLLMINQLVRDHEETFLLLIEILQNPLSSLRLFSSLVNLVERRSKRMIQALSQEFAYISACWPIVIPITLITFQIGIIYTNSIKFLIFFIHFLYFACKYNLRSLASTFKATLSRENKLLHRNVKLDR